jgi:MFS family permease
LSTSTNTAGPEGTAVSVGPPLRRNRNYLLLAGGQIVSVAGSQVSTVAIPLICLTVTGSVAETALVSTMGALPYLLFGLVAGVLVDRWDRRLTMIVCDTIRAAVVLALPAAYIWGGFSLALFCVVEFISGIGFVFFSIAEQSSLKQVVGEHQLKRAVAVNDTAESTAMLVGPGAGGALISLGRTVTGGGALALLVDGLTYCVSVVTLLFIRTPLGSRRTGAESTSIWQELKAGQRFVWTHGNIRTVMLLASALNILFSPTYLALIVHARDDLHTGPTGVGLIFSIGAAGGLLGGLASPWITARVKRGHLMVTALCCWAVALIVVASSPGLWVLILGWGLVTFISPQFDVPSVSYRLSIIPEDMQGRVNSSFRFVAWGLQPLAIGLGGLLIARFGARDFLWGVSIGMVLVALAGLLSRLRRIP